MAGLDVSITADAEAGRGSELLRGMTARRAERVLSTQAAVA